MCHRAGVSLRGCAASAWRILGPGFATGSSDDAPSGIQAYSQTGAQFGYTQLWVAAWSYPFMAAIQEICARIGMVAGRGLAAVLREHYSRPVLHVAVSLLLIANTVNIGADLGAMAATGQLLVHLPFMVWLAMIVGISDSKSVGKGDIRTPLSSASGAPPRGVRRLNFTAKSLK
jgi:NRAMP (natural resistance-associated macrophage protein)-like metal ion transporter